VILLLPLLLLLAACSPAPKAEEAPAFFAVDKSTAGTIRGTIRFTGKKPEARPIPMSADAACAQLHASAAMVDESIVVNKNGTLRNVYVYLKSGLEGKKFAVPAQPVSIDQKGCWFYPRVFGIRAGQQLRVTNSDPVTHNIHPQAQVNRDWNQSQAPEDGPLLRRFPAPEVMIPVKCNVHNWMRAWIGVSEHPYFAVTGADGSFVMENVPPGNYTVAAWQEKLGTAEQTVTLGASAKSDLIFSFEGN